jgi:hypothetical protein
VTEAILFPDVEAFAVAYLGDGRLSALMGAEVFVDTRLPARRPPLAVKVTRAGGTRRSLVQDRPMLWVESWAENDTVAANLARFARAELGAVDDSDPRFPGIAYHAETGGLAYFEDPDSQSPRYVFTVEMSCRGVSA